MSEPEPYPTTRIGDAERDDAVTLLQEHVAAGRITNEEFNDRLNAALEARYADELRPLFADLPGRKPGQALEVAATAPAPAPVPRGTTHQVAKRIGYAITGLMWPAAIITCFVIGWNYWWLMLIPVMCSGVVARAFGIGDHDGTPPTEPR